MLDTLEYDHSVFNPQAAEADRGLAVRFFTLAVRNESKSADAGRPIYDDVVHVEIRTRGSKNDVVHKPVTEEIKRRFRDAWRAYDQGIQMMESGTPLKEWPVMSNAMVEEMRHFGFYTVEHIANARDDVISRFPGLQNMKNRAKAFLELAQGNAPLERLQKELETERSEKAALKAQVDDLAVRFAKMEKTKEKA